MNQTNFFITVILMCVVLLTYEYVWIPIWFLTENHSTASKLQAIPNPPNRLNKISSLKKPVKKFILPAWSRDTPIVFLHIGKSAGTSFDQLMPPIIGGLGLAFIEYST